MSAVEDLLESQLLEAGITDFVRELKAIDGRKFKWDFAFLRDRLLIEVQGGVFMRRGGHTSGVGVTRDCEKPQLGLSCWLGRFASHFPNGQGREGLDLD